MNRLQYETSPYLLQHQHNPVDWYAWKPEAFERARRENKPILVSIGYSTCHWCHVMERESFENPDIAAVMNESFINIKVDREERPDVDAIYMEACQILTGSGGWPLNCFLTPDGKPFYAGTYFPPRPAHGRPSWLQVLQHMAQAWEAQRPTVYEQAEKLMGYIERNDNVLVDTAPPDPALTPAADPAGAMGLARAAGSGGALEAIFFRMRERFDRVEGGFGGAPKFPSSMALQFLLNYYWFYREPEALEHALFSLDKMIMGGIYDQLGGGFSRYATDRAWLVPHFEKMLYDNALLLTVLADAVRLLETETELRREHSERLDRYRTTISETLDYLFREMAHPEGGFYAAQDADSEGVEGKYYVWEKAEIDAALGEDAALFNAFYGVTETGNWEHRNILWRSVGFENFAREQGLAAEALQEKMLQCRARLLTVRAGRIPPGLDDKVLLGWNALMLSALVAAGAAMGEDRYLQRAEQGMAFLLEQLQGPGPTLLHTWKDGQAQYPAMLDDYAFVIAALIDLYEAVFEIRYLELAGQYTEWVLQHFTDASTGLFYFTAAGQEDLVMRKKDLYDNATPSGNSTMVGNLQRLGILLDRPAWRERAEAMLERLLPTLEQYPLSFERWALALLYASEGLHEIGIVGDDAREKARLIQGMFLPNKVLAASREESQAIPLLAGKTGGKDAMIYVCRNFACQRPVTELEALKTLVRR